MMKRLKTIGLGVVLVLLIAGLIIGLGLGQKITKVFFRAMGKKAAIVVDAEGKLGSLPRPWRNLAQGGEETGGMIKPAADQIKGLKPDYIRIDHIYDYYNVVAKNEAGLSFNWLGLDQEVEAILSTGAKPMLALSYMPAGVGADLVAEPYSWEDWQAIVYATISHYSCPEGKNLANVYYEVWNEPDLFGSWKYSGDKNYLQMYRESALAAERVNNCQGFKLGGPATTGFYRNWMEALFKLITEENLRLDFISWHKYSFEPEEFSQDIKTLERLINQYPKLALKERVITEWGPDSNNNSAHDNQLGAAHTMAVTRELLGFVQKAFVFEIMDGVSPEEKEYWGRHGIMTNKKFGLKTKPRYDSLVWLNGLGTTRLKLEGEGSWVKGIASENSGKIQLDLVNYDLEGRNYETVPVVIKNLVPGEYQITTEFFSGGKSEETAMITNGFWSGKVSIPANQLVRISFAK